MSKRSIQKISENTLILISYLEDKELGCNLSYEQIQNDTGVKMDITGKHNLYTAIKRCNLEYECIKGIGIILISTENTGRIIVHKLCRIDNAVKRGKRTMNTVYDRTYNGLSKGDKKQVDLVSAAFGAIQIAAETGKRMIKQQRKIQNNSNLELPQNMLNMSS